MPSADRFVTLKNVHNARIALEKDGYLLLDGVYDRAACQNIVNWIDAYQTEEKTEKHYAGTELRIWDAHKHTEELADFWDQSNVFISCMTSQEMEAHTLLAIRNRAINKDDPNVTRGRWHIDSFRRQYKVFLFLRDVTETTGPFEFIPGTHAPSFKARMALAGKYFAPSDLLARGKTRRYAKLDDNWVDSITSNGHKSVPVKCSAGTVMIIDTSAIHRARPCFEGARYALTSYFR